MNGDVIRRRHYCFHFDEVAQALGVQGEVIKVWAEQDNDYLHIMTNDPTAPATARGGYIEIEPPRVVHRISIKGDTESTGEPNG